MKNILSISLFVLTNSILAQIEQPHRIEFELDNNDDYYTVVCTENKELLLFRLNNPFGTGTRNIELLLVDSLLQRVWADTVVVENKYDFIGYDDANGFFYLLYESNNPGERSYVVVEYDLHSGGVRKFSLKKPFDIDLTGFDVVRGVAIFQGVVNQRPAVFVQNFEASKFAVLPGIYSNKSEVVSLKIDKESETINAIVKDMSFRRRETYSVKTYRLDGQLLRTVKIDPGKDHFLLDAELTTLQRDKIWVSGTYAESRSKYSRGMFITLLSNQGQEYIRFFNYGDFENFFDYLKEKRQKRIARRIERKKEKGKRIKFNYRVLVHEIIERDEEYILVGEAYYPRYSQPNYYGGFNTSDFNVYFDGYRYTHAVVFAFDKQGNRIWDNCFEINDVITFELQQFVNVAPVDDKIVLIYEYDGKIQSKIIEENEVISGKTEIEIATHYESDRIRDYEQYFGGLHYWYEDYFYVYGVQDIRNEFLDPVNKNRTVFYINKLRYSN